MTSEDKLFEILQIEIERLTKQIIDYIRKDNIDDVYSTMNLIIGRRQGLKWALKEIDKSLYYNTPTEPIRIYKIGDEVEITKDNGTVFGLGEKVTVISIHENIVTLEGKDGLLGATMIENIKYLT
jgi:hypothetical protein